jgi:hypothetical protein
MTTDGGSGTHPAGGAGSGPSRDRRGREGKTPRPEIPSRNAQR